MYWLPKLHKRPNKTRFIANSSSCTITELSKLLTSCITADKNHVIRYCEKVYERSGKNLFWSIINSGGSPYMACNERQAFFTSGDTKRYKLWSCQNVCEALIYHLDNIYIRFGTKLYRQIVGIPMGTNCAPLVADLFLFWYERDFMTLSKLKLLKHLNLHLDI